MGLPGTKKPPPPFNAASWPSPSIFFIHSPCQEYTPEQLEAIKVAEAVMQLKAHKLVKPLLKSEYTNDVLARFLRAREFDIQLAAEVLGDGIWPLCMHSAASV